MNETLTLDTRKCDSPVGKARLAPLRRGERGNVTLTVTVRRDRMPYDLTGMTAHLVWQAADGKLVGPVPMEVTDPAAGTVRCTLPEACYAAVGMARAYIELRRGAELVDTTDELCVKVLDCIDADAEQAEEYKPLIAEVRDATDAAIKAAKRAESGEDERVATEAERVAAEDARKQAEDKRAEAEEKRAQDSETRLEELAQVKAAAETATNEANTARDEAKKAAAEAAAAMAIPRFDLSAMGAQVGDWVSADTRSLYKALTSGITRCALDFSGMHFEWNALAVEVSSSLVPEAAEFSHVFLVNGEPVLVWVDVINGENGQINIKMMPLTKAAS